MELQCGLLMRISYSDNLILIIRTKEIDSSFFNIQNSSPFPFVILIVHIASSKHQLKASDSEIPREGG